MLRIQCNIGGFQGGAVTILATLSDENMLVVAKQYTPFTQSRIKEEWALIGNTGDDLDYTFTDKDFSDSIQAFFERKATDTIAIVDELQRFSPDNRLELDKVAESGRTYRLDQSIDNGQIAVLVLSLFAQKQARIKFANDLFDDIDDLYSITTI